MAPTGTSQRGARSTQLRQITRRREHRAEARAQALQTSRQREQRRQRIQRRHETARRPPDTGTPQEPTNWWTRLERAVTLLATVSVLVVAGFTYKSITQVNNQQAITREGQITDRFNAAIGNLGKSQDVRLGGIYALKRLMEDSPRDQPTVVNVISAYIRAHALKPKEDPKTPEVPAIDVAAALSVLMSRDTSRDGNTHVDLTGAHLRNVDLRGVNLADSNLNGANLDHASLSGADLRDAYLGNASLKCADLTVADLGGAFLIGADLAGANLTGANLTGGDFQGRRRPITEGGQPAFVRVEDLMTAQLSGTDLPSDLRNDPRIRARMELGPDTPGLGTCKQTR